MFCSQDRFDIRCEWGEHGVSELAGTSDAIVIVDVLSFSTCVDLATSRGAAVFPYRWKDSSSLPFADQAHAELAGSRKAGGYSLSPASLLHIPAGTRLVLPSPNGSSLSLSTATTPTFAGCLRNAAAVARAAVAIGRRVAIIPAGERWPDGSLRPAVEDLLGAGAILEHLSGSHSPEARAALGVFRSAAAELEEILLQCSSGRELIEEGYRQDVIIAAEYLASRCVPRLHEGAYVNTSTAPGGCEGHPGPACSRG